MVTHTTDQASVNFGQELTLVESRAREISNLFESLQRQADLLKIDLFQHYLEEQRKSIARSRGFTKLLKDKRKVGDSLLMAAGSLILGGLISKDKYVALSAGMSGFDGALQWFGETKWFVSFGRRVLVEAEGSLTREQTWFTWESIVAAIEELRKRAVNGEQTGSLDNIIENVKGKGILQGD